MRVFITRTLFINDSFAFWNRFITFKLCGFYPAKDCNMQINQLLVNIYGSR